MGSAYDTSFSRQGRCFLSSLGERRIKRSALITHALKARQVRCVNFNCKRVQKSRRGCDAAAAHVCGGQLHKLGCTEAQVASYAKRPPSLAAVFPATAMSRRKDHRERGEANVLGRPGSDLLFQVLRLSTIGAGEFYGRVRDGIGYRPPARTTRPAKDECEAKMLVFFSAVAREEPLDIE